MKIGIVGFGFVGKAVDFAFQNNIEKIIIDPAYNNITIEDMMSFHPDAIFVSVPTPMAADKSIDSSIIEDVLTRISRYDYSPIVIIKSTVTPDVLNKIQQIYSRIVYNPEFLTEKNANHDFVNAHALVFGGSQKDIEFCKKLYANHSICNPCPVYETDIAAASLLKYAMNSFLATKVLFFNQFKDVFDSTNTECSWNYFTKMLSADERIGSTHMQVPGPDNRLGFGGACFPKDTSALLHYAKTIGANFSVLSKAVEENSIIRNKYNELDEREKAQNIRFS